MLVISAASHIVQVDAKFPVNSTANRRSIAAFVDFIVALMHRTISKAIANFVNPFVIGLVDFQCFGVLGDFYDTTSLV